jgi:CheY-like chemotaxis protein
LAGRVKILVVDDDDLLRHSLQAILLYTGYDVQVARSGEEALANASHYPFDILVTDYRMEDMDGLRLCRELRKQGKVFVPVLISGYSDDEMLEEARREGVTTFFFETTGPGTA